MNLDSLFEAARQDGPSDQQKKSSWNEIANLTGAATVAAAGAYHAKSSVGVKALALKIVLVSALAITAGGAALSAAGDAGDSLATSAPSHGGAGRTGTTPHASFSTAAVTNRALAIDSDELAGGGVIDVGMPAVARELAPVAAAEEESGLALESRLVTEARAAVVRGDAAAAVQLLQKAKSLKGRALEPEELALEARAARALGHVDTAEAAELQLKSRYPEHALAR